VRSFAKYHYNDQVNKHEMSRECSTHREKRDTYRVLVGKPEGKRPLERPRRRREDNIKMDRREIKWGSMDRINRAHDCDQWWALVNTLMNLRVP
jgi:hypothetical protein